MTHTIKMNIIPIVRIISSRDKSYKTILLKLLKQRSYNFSAMRF